MRRRVLIVGATGATGSYAADKLRARANTDVVGLARRPPKDASFAFVTCNLLDRDDAVQTLASVTGITDLVFAGFVPAPDYAAQVGPNREILANTIDGLQAGRSELRRIVLIQGMKYYGSHRGPFKTPAREDDPRHSSPNYYYDQQDLLEQASGSGGWSWTCLRPHVIAGTSLRSAQNILTVLGVYAAIRRELDLPLTWPGTREAFEAANEATDAVILAEAVAWALDEPAAADQAFNVTNGDCFRWCNLWPRVAALFAMQAGDPEPIDMTSYMQDKGALWQQIIARDGLVPQEMTAIASWSFADDILRRGWDVLASTVKIREAGFGRCRNSENMYLDYFAALQAQRVLPR